MDNTNRDQAELAARYDALKREIERRGGVVGQLTENVVPLPVQVQFLERVLRCDDENHRERRN